MADNFYDDLDANVSSELKPFFLALRESKSEKDIHSWLKQAFEALTDEAQPRTEIQKENLFLYRGVTQQQMVKWYAPEGDTSSRRFNKFQKFVINHLYDLTETKVSQMTRLKPDVQILPTNDEWRDRAAAKVVKNLKSHIFYMNDLDAITRKMHLHCRIFGETYLFQTWDKTKGDLHPAYVEARDQGLSSIQLANGKQFSLKKPIKTGDICFDVEVPWRVLLQRKRDINKVDYCFRVQVENTDEVKEDYKNKEVNSDDMISTLDIESLQDKFLENQTLVIEFWHKKTDKVPEGYYAKFTLADVLEKDSLKYSDGLPFTRLTDLDIPDVLNGVSRYETISNIQNMYNNLSTLIAKNIYLTAHAKWVMPKNAAKIEHLGNDNTVVQYRGPIAPSMIQVSPNPPEVYQFREMLKEEMQVIYGNHGISRGEVPKGITAASALQFLNELESMRATTDIAKHNKMIKDIAVKTIATAGDFYDIDDGRMVRIVGENNKYLIRHFDAATLSKSYDVRVENSTAFPELKSAKMQRILDAMQRNPAGLPAARWEELLELGDTDKLNSLLTEAIKAADSENEDMLSDFDVGMPDEWEDHVSHWNAHSKGMQSRQFKEDATESVRKRMKDHVYWTEEAMLDKASKNPEFSAQLATLNMFPIFFHPGHPAPVSREQQIAMVQGQANRGAQVTGTIPGVDKESIVEQENALKKLG